MARQRGASAAAEDGAAATQVPGAGEEEAELLLGLYRTMVLIRRFEEKVQTLFLRGHIYGSTHLCIGQEAVGTGVCSALGPEDWVSSTYRGHHNILAIGTDAEAFMAELLGRATGVCGGRAGSMNLVDLEHRLIGCFGIIGGALAAATGLGLAHRGTGRVAVGFLGDGAVNQAYFHECLNFAKVHELPVVYVCENNGYGEYTPMERTTPGGIVARPQALGIPTLQVDGQDVWAVRLTALEALAQARAESGPVFVEARTYRYSDHGRGDPVAYRPEGEMEAWRARDPLDIASARLREDHDIPEERIVQVAEETNAFVEQITESALAAPFPDPSQPATEFAPTVAA